MWGLLSEEQFRDEASTDWGTTAEDREAKARWVGNVWDAYGGALDRRNEQMFPGDVFGPATFTPAVPQVFEPDVDFESEMWVKPKPPEFGDHIPWGKLSPEQQRDEETFFHNLPHIVPKAKPDVYSSPGYLPPQLHKSDPGRLDPDPPGFWPEMPWTDPEGGLDLTPGPGSGLPWTDPDGGFDFTPGPRGGLPWTDPDGGFDFTPGPRGGLPWTDDEGKLDLTPGAGTGILGFDIPDLSNLLPIMLLAMVVKER